MKKGGASSLSTEFWQWRFRNNNNKKKKKKRGNKLPFCRGLVMALEKQQKRTKKGGAKLPLY
jgi:hypothetical protein